MTEPLPYDELTEHTLPALLRVLGERHGDREAVVAPEGRVSYAELLERCAEMAAYYAEAGLVPGERVGVLLPNGLRWLVATLGAQLAGLTAVPINTWYRSAEYAHVIATAELRLLVTEEKLFGRAVLDDLAEAGYPGRFEPSRFEPSRFEPSRFGSSAGAGYRGALLWPADAPRAPGVSAGGATPNVTVRPEDTALVLFTSGSTAVPKTVPLRHGGLVRNSRAMGERQHLVPGDRLWFALPMFFGYGCANALPVALDHAVTLCLQERVDGEAALEFIERERCTVYYGLGPANHLLRAAPSFGHRDISSLRTGTTGMSAEDKRVAIEELGVSEVCSVYGLTEAYGHSTMTDALDPLEVKLHTVGRILPTQQIRVVDELGDPRPCGETGEVQLRGCVIDGYLNMPEVDAVSFQDGWFRTGDLGFLDERDYLHFVGRSKEMIKVKGINIAPAEVEDVLGGNPAIAQVHVVGASDGGGGELIVAFVVPRSPDADPDSLAKQLTEHIRTRAASYKVPARFVSLAAEDIPLTATGKVSKLKLRELAERHLGTGQ